MNELKAAISTALDWCEKKTRVTPEIADLAVYHGVKTAAYFDRVIMQWVNDLYNHDVTEAEFVDRFADLIQQQLTRAFHEGMRINGLDPITDMTDEWAAALQDMIANEYTFVDRFAADIASGKFTLAQMQARAGMWSNRYSDIKNQSVLLTAGGKDRLIWQEGDTVDKCPMCVGLDGIVAFASEWETLGIKPQDERLTCHGYNCHCTLTPTDKRRTRDAYGRIEEILLAG